MGSADNDATYAAKISYMNILVAPRIFKYTKKHIRNKNRYITIGKIYTYSFIW